MIATTRVKAAIADLGQLMFNGGNRPTTTAQEIPVKQTLNRISNALTTSVECQAV
jgi:hypothetical protein